MIKSRPIDVEALTAEIQRSYESGITMDEAERLAAKFLHAQIDIAQQLQAADLDTRMKKNGYKTIRAAIFVEEATKGEKKPSDTLLDALVTKNSMVADQLGLFDEAEANRNVLQAYYDIFKDAHIHFRSIAKGKFD